MPISNRFSKEAILREFQRDSKSRRLADELQVEVQRGLHLAVSDAVAEIVAQLAELGHHLQHFEEPSPGLIALRDDHVASGTYECDLRLAVDTVVSVGFRDTVGIGDLE